MTTNKEHPSHCLFSLTSILIQRFCPTDTLGMIDINTASNDSTVTLEPVTVNSKKARVKVMTRLARGPTSLESTVSFRIPSGAAVGFPLSLTALLRLRRSRPLGFHPVNEQSTL